MDNPTACNQITVYVPIFIALVALVFTFLQIRAWKKHHRLSVTPHLIITFYSSNVDEKGMRFELKNSGTGPAIFKTLTVSKNNGKSCEIKTARDLITFDKFLGIEENILHYKQFDEDSWLKVDYSGVLLGMQAKCLNDEKAIEIFRKVAFELGFKIEYESIYGEKFTCNRPPLIT